MWERHVQRCINVCRDHQKSKQNSKIYKDASKFFKGLISPPDLCLNPSGIPHMFVNTYRTKNIIYFIQEINLAEVLKLERSFSCMCHSKRVVLD